MWTLQDRTKSATEVAAIFAATAFEEPRQHCRLKPDGTFRLVGGRQTYRLSVDTRTATWTVETQMMH
jgi:hypothetical protein